MKRSIKSKFTPLASVAIAASITLGAAQAATINVDITSSDGAAVTNPGYGLWSQASETWHVGARTGSTNLVDSTGTATSLSYTTGNTSGVNNFQGPDAMVKSAVYGVKGGTTFAGGVKLTIGGLSSGASYELITYHTHAGNLTNTFEQAVGASSVAPVNFTGTLTTGYIDAFDVADPIANANYFWYYDSVTADGSGNIQIQAYSNDAGDFSSYSGFQIRPVPEPGVAGLIGLTGMMLLLRRRHGNSAC